MTRLEIKASFPVSDNQREVARIMAKLDEPTAAFEAAIKAATGLDVDVTMRAVRGKEEKPAAPSAPVLVEERPETVRQHHAAE